MDLQRLFDDLTDRHSRIQRGVSVLEDHLNIRPIRTHLRAVQRRHIHDARWMAIEDLSPDPTPRGNRAESVDDVASPGTLAAPAFSNQARALAFVLLRITDTH